MIYTPKNPEQLALDESLLCEIPECAEVIKTRIKEKLETADLNNMTPLQAFDLIRELKGELGI